MTKPSDFSYPVKLLESAKVYTNDSFNEKFDIEGEGLLQLYQVFERCDQVWASDNNPVRRYNRTLLEWFNHEPLFSNAEANVIAEAFEEVCGCDMLPDNPDTAAFIGHFFKMKDVKVPRAEKLYMRIPVEYLGADYVYTGKVTEVEGGTREEADEAPAVTFDNDVTTAIYLASILDGSTEASIRGGAGLKLIGGDETFNGVSKVLGVNLRGGLVKPKALLLDKLVEEGFLTVDDGVLNVV